MQNSNNKTELLKTLNPRIQLIKKHLINNDITEENKMMLSEIMIDGGIVYDAVKSAVENNTEVASSMLTSLNEWVYWADEVNEGLAG